MDRLMTKTLADVYLRQGHYQEAYKILKTLLERDPSDKEILEKLRALSEKSGTPSPVEPFPRSPEERMEVLKRWLANIRKRKKA